MRVPSAGSRRHRVLELLGGYIALAVLVVVAALVTVGGLSLVLWAVEVLL